MTLTEAREYLASRPMDLKALQVLELLERMEWQPIETVPRNRSWVLCWGHDVCDVFRFAPNIIWAEYPEVTHWMPLPKPPAPHSLPPRVAQIKKPATRVKG